MPRVAFSLFTCFISILESAILTLNFLFGSLIGLNLAVSNPFISSLHVRCLVGKLGELTVDVPMDGTGGNEHSPTFSDSCECDGDNGAGLSMSSNEQLES